MVIYTGTAEFSFVADPINVYKYSGTTVYTYYPPPTVSMTNTDSETIYFDASATDLDSNGWPSSVSAPYCTSDQSVPHATPGGSLATTPGTYGGNFVVGTHTITCTATDGAGGTGTASFDITVIADTISGSPTCPAGPNPQLAVGSTIRSSASCYRS